MPKSTPKYNFRLKISLKHRLSNYWQKNIFTKISVLFICFVIVAVLIMYSVGQWYIASEANNPTQLGVSFIPDYASFLGLNPQSAMDSLIGVNVKLFRIVSYWSDVEPNQNQYNFSQLDWEFSKAEAAHDKIILVLGLRHPRW